MPIDDNYWKAPPKPEGGLPEDGTYYARAGLATSKVVSNGATEIFELPVTVEEHAQYAGEDLDIGFVYYLRHEWNAPALDRLKKISDSIDPTLRQKSVTPLQWMDALANLLNGRKVKFDQKTGKDGKAYLNLLEVYEAESLSRPAAPPAQAARQASQPTRNEMPPMEDTPW